MIYNYPFYRQLTSMDCGPTCLRMIARYYGRSVSINDIKKKSNLNREGVSLMDIADAADAIGFRTVAVKIPFQHFLKDAVMPCIIFVNQTHFVVVYHVRRGKVLVADPAVGFIKYTLAEFKNIWCDKDEGETGIALMLEPTPAFYNDPDAPKKQSKSLLYLLRYLVTYRKLVVQLLIALLISSMIQLTFPFFTQSVVDVGIAQGDLSLIYLILAGQLVLFLARTVTDFIKRWILLHLGVRINVSILSDFLSKMMRLPLSYFDNYLLGDTMQRIEDHNRIEKLLSSTTLTIIFSIFNFVLFSCVLAYYNLSIFLFFAFFSVLYISYILLFLKRRKVLDYKKFSQLAQNQSNIYQIVTAMPEIKLNTAETEKRWEWEEIQSKLYKINISSLQLRQYQESGSLFINELKNILITFMTAQAVINGQMTLGMMISVQYIIGVLNGPVSDIVSFVREYQDASLSLERIQEVQMLEEEDNYIKQQNGTFQALPVPHQADIVMRNLYFRYGGPRTPEVIKGLSFTVPYGKVTAIVGASGSGKTTLLKLFLKFYEAETGGIYLNNTDLRMVHSREWRKKCGVVMQDGVVFPDTIFRNVTIGDPHPDLERFLNALRIANIHEYVAGLPLGYNTKIGNNGIGLSHGQKQRILIARAVYKDPEYLLFDEATSALDATNERIIVENLSQFFKNRTVLIIAHRLSTVKNADQILVLGDGQLLEDGSHTALVKHRGHYFELIRNQLELGN